MKVFLLSYIWGLLLFQTAIGQGQDYIWPTDASPYLTSTFGETRAAHYHSGLDIKTWGREGYNVFAAKDGVVYRIGISVDGYGKVIYLKHNDGTFTVYAHLQRFNTFLQSYIDSIRVKDYTFEIDVNVESLNFKVTQGDIIGFTGSTGVGPPHLHFETRDQNDNPFNALSTNLSISDSLPPTLSALMIFPLSDTTRIRNSEFPQLYYPNKSSDGLIDFGSIDAHGPIGLTISTFDEAEGVTNKYAVYELTLLSEADTIFHEKLDRFEFKEDDIMFTDRLTAYKASRRSYQTLFKKDGPQNPFYIKLSPSTVIIPQDSLQNFTIIAKDYYGNETKSKLTILDSNESKIASNNSQEKPIWDWYWTEDWAFDGLQIIDIKNLEFGYPWDIEQNQYITNLLNTPKFWTRIQPEKRHSFTTPSKELTVKIRPNTFFDTLTIVATTGFLDALPYINLQPNMIPARKEFSIQYYLGEYFEPNQKYRLFRFDRQKNRISYIDSELKGRTIHATPSDLGEFVVVPDNEAPTSEIPRIIKTNYNKWLVTFKTNDNLTGIDFEKTQIFVNGVKGIVEFDNEEDILIYYHPDFKPEKENIITARIYDKSGNLFAQTYRL